MLGWRQKISAQQSNFQEIQLGFLCPGMDVLNSMINLYTKNILFAYKITYNFECCLLNFSVAAKINAVKIDIFQQFLCFNIL